MNKMYLIAGLLVAFQFKHFLCDFPLQGRYMLGKFRDTDWILPLSAHAAVHSVATIFIVWMFVTPPWILVAAIFDFVVHFTMDRIKASPKMLGRYKAMVAADFTIHEQFKGISDSQFKSGNLDSAQLLSAYQMEDLRFAAKLKSNKYFWWSLGLDQAVHHLTHYAIIAGVLMVMK